MDMLVLVYVFLLCVRHTSAQAVPHPPSDASYTQPSYKMIGENFTFTCKQISGYSAQWIYLWNSRYRYTDGNTITDPYLFSSSFHSNLAPNFPSELKSRLTLKSGSENGLNVWSITVTNINNNDFGLYGCYNKHGTDKPTTITELRKFEPATSPLSLSCSQLQEKSAGNCSCESTGANPAPNFSLQVDEAPVDNSTDNVKIYVERVDGGKSHAVIAWKAVPRDIKKLDCEVTGPGDSSWRQKTEIDLNVSYKIVEGDGSGSQFPVAAVAGAVGGSVVIIVIVIGVVVFRRRRGKPRGDETQEFGADDMIQPYSEVPRAQPAAPSYSEVKKSKNKKNGKTPVYSEPQRKGKQKQVEETENAYELNTAATATGMEKTKKDKKKDGKKGKSSGTDPSVYSNVGQNDVAYSNVKPKNSEQVYSNVNAPKKLTDVIEDSAKDHEDWKENMDGLEYADVQTTRPARPEGEQEPIHRTPDAVTYADLNFNRKALISVNMNLIAAAKCV